MRKIFELRFSSFLSPRSKFFALVAALAAALTLPISASAQGCAMCANNASAVRAEAIKSLQNGILILLIPVVLMAGGFAVLVYRSRNRFHGGGYDADGGRNDELTFVAPLPPDHGREARLEVQQESETPVGASL